MLVEHSTTGDSLAAPSADAPRNPLLALTPALLHHVTGDRRKQLLAYLRRWNEHATALRYLDTWVAAEPNLATLRQARAEALIEVGQPEMALHELDQLDEERGPTTSRRNVRLAALLTARDWAGVETLIGSGLSTIRGDMFLAQGRYEEAQAVFSTLAALREGPPTLREARVALLRGEAARSWALLQARQAVRGDAQTAPDELRLLRDVAAAMADAAAYDDAVSRLAALEETERARLIELLGLDVGSDLEIVPDVPADEPGNVQAPEDATALLRSLWGYDAFRGGQAASVTRVLDGRSTLAVLPTGAGKSLTYQLPALLMEGATVVISPLIALMKDQLDGLPPSVREQTVAINSMLTAGEVAQRLKDVRAGRYKLVYVAPERLRQQSFVQALREAGIARFVVDEAHCVSLWGLSFRPDYLFIRRVLEHLGHPPVLALTATATPDTRGEIVAQLGEMDLVAASVFRSNLHFSVVKVPNAEAKTVALLEQCRAIDGPVLVYARSRERCEELAHLLRRRGIKAGHYHAQVDDRGRAQEAFMSGEVRVLVATVAFGMGVDKADIRAIIHYNLPQSVEAYYQEAGRAGRDGKPSRCVLLYTSGNKAQLTSWLRQDALTREDLRLVYRALRARSANGYALAAADALGRDLPELDETRLRVALGMLERAELLIRHFDLPRRIRLTLLEGGAEEHLQQLAVAARLRQHVASEIDLLDLANALDRRPYQVEADLLRWSAQGYVRLESGPRELLLELLPPPADAAARIEQMLWEYATRQDARIDAMVGYATGLSCRHQALAAHFGERLAACGVACDVCAGDRSAVKGTGRAAAAPRRPNGPPISDAEAMRIALRTLRDLPFNVGRTGLTRILSGSVESAIGPDRCDGWGKLQSWTKTATGRLIDRLVEDGLAGRNERGEYPVLELTPAGRALLDDDE
ncbi:MAG TPA: RecQ family ATP-dependent DNA helicase [Herpetosiphonaceae bacterium]|nr:RecQ family ATP-dependent DNA helicase [Herpetosiphonaceae bacterium]